MAEKRDTGELRGVKKIETRYEDGSPRIRLIRPHDGAVSEATEREAIISWVTIERTPSEA